MASLTDTPSLHGYRQSARQYQSLINKQYRYAKRRGDFGEALKAMRMGDEMGLPIGRPARIEEIDQTGEAAYNFDMKRQRMLGGMQPPGAPAYRNGMGAADVLDEAGVTPDRNREAPMPGTTQGMGGAVPMPTSNGYPPPATMPETGYLQGRGYEGAPTPAGVGEPQPSGLLPPPKIAAPDASVHEGLHSQAARPVTQAGMNRYRGNQLVGANGGTNSGSIGGYDFSQRNPSPLRPVSEGGQGHRAYPSVHNVPRGIGFSRNLQLAKTPEERVQIIQKAKAAGVPMDAESATKIERDSFSQMWQKAASQRAKDKLVQQAYRDGVPMDDAARDAALERIGDTAALDEIDKGSPANRPDTAYADLSPSEKAMWDRTAAREKKRSLSLAPSPRSGTSSLLGNIESLKKAYGTKITDKDLEDMRTKRLNDERAMRMERSARDRESDAASRYPLAPRRI